MAVSNIRKYGSLSTYKGKECDGCHSILGSHREDMLNKVAITTTRRIYCARCQASSFDMEAYASLFKGE